MHREKRKLRKTRLPEVALERGLVKWRSVAFLV
jgi:hypothetical protein